MDYEALYYKLQKDMDKQQQKAEEAAKARQLADATEEAAQERVGRQIREIVNLNAEHRGNERAAAEAEQLHKAAIQRREAESRRAAAKTERWLLTAYLLLGMFSIGVLGYLVGAGEGLRVLASLLITVGIMLVVVATHKLRSKRRKGEHHERF